MMAPKSMSHWQINQSGDLSATTWFDNPCSKSKGYLSAGSALMHFEISLQVHAPVTQEELDQMLAKGSIAEQKHTSDIN